MATYVYETIPQRPGDPVKTFEIQQSMRDNALTHHPQTGEPVRRLILGGFGFIKAGGSSAVAECPDGGACDNPAGPGGAGCCCAGPCSHN